jgi:adenylosuccinate lyase
MIHPIENRYGSREMREIFDEERKLELELKVEAALALALADLGVIPVEAARTIEEKATLKFVKLDRVKKIEEETHHDLMAVVKALAEASGDAGKYVHLTSTSYDVVDTALALQMKQGLEILLAKGKNLLKILLDFAQKHIDLAMVGRTHGQHAVPITLGFKFANYCDKVGDGLKRLEGDRFYVRGKFSGAVGTCAAQQIYGIGGQLEKKIMARLGIAAADISTQVVARENIARIICDLAVLAGTLEQIAKEIRNLQRTEICELAERFGPNQVGSSTMAQKQNPVNAENICGNARVIRSCVAPALEDIALEHERDLTNSSCERSIMPTVFVLSDEILGRAASLVAGLQVFPENIKKNLTLTKGAIMAEAVITLLTKKGADRQVAHEILRESSRQAARKNCSLAEVLAQKPEVLKYLNESELDKITDYNNYIGLSAEKTAQIVDKWKIYATN